MAQPYAVTDVDGHHRSTAGGGDFAQTLTVTDIATGWKETQAVKNNAQKWVFAALMQIRAALPLLLLGINPDDVLPRCRRSAGPPQLGC